ncbi:MAG: M23 family metallopeptidase [Flavobacteriaceae bacterium]|nr:M23 family metallopeptidase [Flavobacteriaceae bacterium]
MSKKNKLREKLTLKYRLVILNEDSLEERVSFKLNRLNVYVIGGVFIIGLIVLTTLLIAFSPLKEYIPGYSSSKLKKTATKLVLDVDSLGNNLAINEIYINNIKNVLNGNIKIENLKKNATLKEKLQKDINLNATKLETEFRENITEKERFSLLNKTTKKPEIVFFAPAKGKITNGFNQKDKHFAVDIALTKGTSVKAVANGTVIFADYTAETGYVLILKHTQSYLSVYKHNSTLLKEQGDLVKSGEVIANSGDTGSFTSGPHLHFELWSGGYPINPTNFIDFK